MISTYASFAIVITNEPTFCTFTPLAKKGKKTEQGRSDEGQMEEDLCVPLRYNVLERQEPPNTEKKIMYTLLLQ